MLSPEINSLYDTVIKRVKGFLVIRVTSASIEYILPKEKLKNIHFHERYLHDAINDCQLSEVALFQNNKCIGIVKLMAHGESHAHMRRIGFKMLDEITVVRVTILTAHQRKLMEEFLCSFKSSVKSSTSC
jgi:hypothetical protein